MKQVGVGVDIAAPTEIVWDLIARFEHWPDWGTTISKVTVDHDIVASEVVAPGVVGRVRTIVGIWLPFEITEVEPGRAWTWRVAGQRATGHSVMPLGASRSRLEFTVGWVLLPYLLPMWLAVRRIRALVEAKTEG
ncbi:MAG: hypothetical protein HKN91_01705 [Acidimicrobiia bacterium]|nr:hypothetical protein [Acidimicrobiia bacterium]